MSSFGSVSRRLLARYYPRGEAVPDGASSHWREFSQKFTVTADEHGNVAALSGYGFGESHRSSMRTRIASAIGVIVQLLSLRSVRLIADTLRARRLVHRMGLRFSQDAFRQVCTDWRVADAWAAEAAGRDPEHLMVIGDGHGILAALLHARFPNARITLIDLGPTLLFQSVHLQRAYPQASHALSDEEAPSPPVTFTYCPAGSTDSLPDGCIDIAFNVASMQEMPPAAISAYFQLMRDRRTRLFYCCNRLEKRLAGGEVLRIMDYPWTSSDEHLIDEPCPWHQWSIGRGSTPRVRFAGLPLPFVHRYDGLHWHRLTRLSHES